MLGGFGPLIIRRVLYRPLGPKAVGRDQPPAEPRRSNGRHQDFMAQSPRLLLDKPIRRTQHRGETTTCVVRGIM